MPSTLSTPTAKPRSAETNSMIMTHPNGFGANLPKKNAQVIGGPVLAGDWVFVIDGNGILYMIDVDRGRTRYSLDLWEGGFAVRVVQIEPRRGRRHAVRGVRKTAQS